MPEQSIAPPGSLEFTYKGRDVEGLLDLFFYRKVGFWLARRFAQLNLKPASVTLLGGVVGVLAAHLYYYSNVVVNVWGMVLHVCANALDNADGQLARLSGRQSRDGRIFDGVIDYLVFISIYLHLGFRCLSEGASSWIWLLVLGAAISHGLQSAAADYIRNAYLHFVMGRGEFDSSHNLSRQYNALAWSAEPRKKIWLWLYLRMTREQEFLVPKLSLLHLLLSRDAPDAIPNWLRKDYRAASRSTLKWWGLLMTNTRMLVLFAVLFIAQPLWFFWLELLPLNALFAGLLLRQRKICNYLLLRIEVHTKPA